MSVSRVVRGLFTALVTWLVTRYGLVVEHVDYHCELLKFCMSAHNKKRASCSHDPVKREDSDIMRQHWSIRIQGDHHAQLIMPVLAGAL